MEYLEEILASSPRYRMIDLSDEGVGFVGYANAWGHLERGALYFKIDDDVVRMYLKWVIKITPLTLHRSGLPMMPSHAS